MKRDNLKQKDIFDSIAKIFEILPKITSLIIGFTAFAYIIGWLQARSYFGELGASWMLDDLTPLKILGFSWFPIALFIFFGYLTTLDLAEGLDSFKKSITIIFRYWKPIFILLVIIQGLIKFFKWDLVISIFSFIFAILVLFVATAAYGNLLILLEDPKAKLNLAATYTIYTIVILAFYFVPENLGTSKAYQDIDPQRTSLARIQLRNEQSDSLHLLYMNGDRYYGINLPIKEDFPRIRIIERNEIKSILKTKVNKDKSRLKAQEKLMKLNQKSDSTCTGNAKEY